MEQQYILVTTTTTTDGYRAWGPFTTKTEAERFQQRLETTTPTTIVQLETVTQPA